MKILQVVPKAGIAVSLKQLLKSTERKLRGPKTTFVRTREGRWTHKVYGGHVNWHESPGGVLAAQMRPKKDAPEWKLLVALIGYLDRHLGKQIESITIVYR